MSAVADVEIAPSISANYVHVIEAETSGQQYEGHEVLLLSPSLQIERKGTVWELKFDADHTEQQQLQSGYDDISYTNFRLDNKLSWWQNRIQFGVNAQRNYENIDRSFAGASDILFGRSEFIDVDDVSANLLIQNSGRGDWQNSLRFEVSETDFDENQIVDTSSTTTAIVKGSRQGAALQLQYGRRPGKLTGGLNIAVLSTDRENRGKQDNMTGTFNFGVPIYETVYLVANATAFKTSIDNTLLLNSDLENETYGAGLAWRFGARSNIEVTFNKDTQGEEEEFIGYKLQVFPSERSSLDYEQSRRFYGESHSLNLNHKGNRWSVNVSYGEDLSSQTRLDRNRISLGNFLCPTGAVTSDECVQIFEPLEPDQIGPDQQVGEFFDTEFSIDEVVTLSKSGTATFSYRFRKAQLSLSYSKGETEYLELNTTRDDESFSLNYVHNMSRRNTLRFAANKSESEGEGNDRDLYNVSLSFDRKLTRKATASLILKKIKNEAGSGINSREDTRAELKYTYSF